MESGIELAVFLMVIVLLVGPVLAIAAFVRLSRLTPLIDQIPRLTARIFDLERKLAALERAAASGGSAAAGTQPSTHAAPEAAHVVWQRPGAPAQPEPPAHVPAPATSAAHPATPPPAQVSAHSPSPAVPLSAPYSGAARSRSNGDVETMIAGHWFYYVGILAIALAMTFFLKYAFDNNWIGPTGRVAIGMLVGAALFPLSQWLLGRGYKYFSEGIAGLGAAILYLSIWAGWHYYQLFGQTPAFVMMMVVTALVTAVALARDSQRIAVLALIGGLLTPSLVSTGQNAEVVLFTYLAVLAAAMLVIARRRDWIVIPPLLFLSTLFYFWGWWVEFYSASELETTLIFATLFFVVFEALPAVESWRAGAQMNPLDVVLLAGNALQYLAALRQMLWPEYRWGLTFGVLVLAAAHLAAERALPNKRSEKTQSARILYAALALLFVTVAIPIRLDGNWVTVAWATEALVLVWSGLRASIPPLRWAGLVMFGIVGFRLLVVPPSAGLNPAFLMNPRFLVLAFCAGCGALSFFIARRSPAQVDAAESNLFFALAIAANACFLLALSREVWDFLRHSGPPGIDRERAQELGLSILWVVYALAQLVPGVISKSQALRWQGLTLMGVAIVKVFFFDLSFLSSFYRIVSFFALGLVLLGVSFFYQKMSQAAGQKT
jgi:uncharacterized membrane protein